MATMTRPGTEVTHLEPCGRPSCGRRLRFVYDERALAELAEHRSLSVRAECPRCRSPQHVLVTADGAVSGPWLATH
ncbi:MAG: hypothetical protein M3Z03_10430 [Actinomycetota bacterium]|nr:hypothetical protein [Actinomycetota bacterium]